MGKRMDADRERVRCSNCGYEGKQNELKIFKDTSYIELSFSIKGIPKEERDTMVQCCPKCGLCLGRLDEDILVSDQVLKTREYTYSEMPEESRPFLKAANVYLSANRKKDGVRYLVYGAQLIENKEKKTTCYAEAAEIYLSLYEENRCGRDWENLLAIDVMRRAGWFKLVHVLCRDWDKNKTENKRYRMQYMIRLEEQLALREDDSEYSYIDLMQMAFRTN